jgi:predicted methyltransferase
MPVRWRPLALALLLAGLASAQAQERAGAPVFPAPDRPVAGITSPTYSDEKTRDGHGEAERVMDRLGIKPGQRVADIGAGLGYYTVRLAQRLGPGRRISVPEASTARSPSPSPG